MFEKLFTRPIVVHRHKHAPYREERERYLEHCERQGYKRVMLRKYEQELVWVAKKMRIDPEHGVTLQQVKDAARGWKRRGDAAGRTINSRRARIRFIQVAKSWLRFLGCWREPNQSVPFGPLIEEYKAWMEHERGFTFLTISRLSWYLSQFLRWYERLGRSFSEVCIKDTDAFLASYGAKGNCRTSVRNMAQALRIFFKYAGSKGWCSSSIAPEIRGPRIYAQEQLPSGPTWEDVRRLIVHAETDRASDIRDRAIIMLCAIYGFRSSEVATLRLDDFDWEQSLLSVSRAKRRERQTYPLVPVVGDAIIRYLREVRPRSSMRELFLTRTAPLRPLSSRALYQLVSRRISALGISVPHIGPHSLRHACATHLITEGLSLKEIGDHLGHRSPSSTTIYAKVDLPSLREVADFDLGDLS